MESNQRDASNWAKPVTTLKTADVPTDAINRNVDGKRLSGPFQGFGKMWQKTYRLRLPGATVTPEQLIATWKINFPQYWPAGNRFYGPLTGIAPGEVALINADMPGKLKMSTGVMVLYADDVSFTFMTPESHVFAGWVTFSAATQGDDTLVQVQVLMRGQDPLTEVALVFGGHRKEDRFWQDTLRNLASSYGAEVEVETDIVCVDKKRQWKRWSNIRHDAPLHSAAYQVTRPFRRRRVG